MATTTTVIIVGAGLSGLSKAACLTNLSIPYILLEREDCIASIWKKYSYDRLHLHLFKKLCELPLKGFPTNYPTYVPKDLFLNYLDDYVSHFSIKPKFLNSVEEAVYDEESKKWKVVAKNLSSGEMVEYSSEFLVVATGETSNAFVPAFEGLDEFSGEVIHSTRYKNGKPYENKNVLVVGSGNSGMEIALDLFNHGAKASIAIRSPIRFVSKWMLGLGIYGLKYHIPLYVVDSALVILSKLFYGDLRNFGIQTPQEGPILSKEIYGRYPVTDCGTFEKIKSSEIQVISSSISKVRGNEVVFKEGKSYTFDAIIFATGFKRSTNMWLKGDEYLLNDDGLPKPAYPNHWKGKNGLYCIGLARQGIFGASAEAGYIADDIHTIFSSIKKNSCIKN